MLIILAGLPGTGKTTVARALAIRLHAAHVRVDTIEQAMKAAAPHTDVGAGGYLVAYRIAADNLRLGLTVVADCVNAASISRAAWARVAAEASHSHLFVHVVCSDVNEHRRRVECRVADIAGHALPDWAAVQALRMEPFAGEHVCVDTASLSVEGAVELIGDTLRSS